MSVCERETAVQITVPSLWCSDTAIRLVINLPPLSQARQTVYVKEREQPSSLPIRRNPNGIRVEKPQ